MSDVATSHASPELPLTFFVRGKPIPKGSFIPLIRNGKPTLIPQSNTALRQWTAECKNAGRAAMGWEPQGKRLVRSASSFEPLSGYLRIYILLALERPKSNRSPYPATLRRDDGDKHERAIWDALHEIVVADDALFVDHQMRKRWAGVGPDSLPWPGARITIERLPDGRLIT